MNLMSRERRDSAGTLKAFAAFGAVYFIWGSTYLAIKFALESIPPFLLMGTRSLLAGVVLTLWGRYRNGGRVHREHWPSLVIIGLAFFLIGHGSLAWAQQKVPSGLAALLVAVEPMWIALIEWIVVRDFNVGIGGMIGLVMGFLGIVLLILPTRGLGGNEVDLLGAGAIVVGTLSWSGGAVFAKVAKLPSSPVLTAGLELIIGGVGLVIAALVLGETVPPLMSARSLLSLGYLVVFGSIITFSAYVWLLTVTSATRVATHTYVNPVIAILLGWALSDEQLTINILVAAVVIIASVYLVLRDRTMKPLIMAGT